MTTETVRECISAWCAAEGLPLRPGEDDAGTLVVELEPAGALDVRIDLGDGERAVRFRQTFPLWDDAADGDHRLDEAALDAIVAHAVRRRSSLIDARVTGAGTADIAVSVYPDGLSRHTFMTAIYECLKLRDSVRADVHAAAVAATAVETLELLADRVD